MVFTDEGLRSALLARCRSLKIEPPGRADRIVGAGRARFEREFCLHVLNGLSADAARSLWKLATGEDVFINTLLVQSVLKDPAWQQKMTDADKRGLSPLFWSNANLYGTIDIDMGRRLDLDLAA
ncbi:Tn3 family transposase [Actinomadura sp. 21ATH]|uniref:Tn3 family transposase n=1 Tax=Actinomadura sp. 21ATH TaxID=1735444 RepID=UPI0035C1382F